MLVRGVAGLVAALALVAGCGSDPAEPRSLPPVTTEPSTSPSASPSAAPVPSEAQAATPQGAAEFARFFYAEVRRAFAAKDPEIIRRLSAPGCEACTLFVDSLTKLRDNNERATDVFYDIKVAEAPSIDGDSVNVTVIYDSPKIQRFDSSGKVITEEPAVTGFEEQVTLVRSSNRWLVQEVKAV